MSQITTHILDTTLGKPAAGVTIALSAQQAGDTWQELARGTTNQDGRIPDLLPKEQQLPPGVYKMKFFTQAYFERQGTPNFYPFVEIVFHLSAAEHYHIPLLLNPFGYSTYRGS
ncbi:hydroxyisourate hydrolase [Hymenobacter busanensis]|uniref:5-hydroxyisourate hydrolase n=1 Tax=Hymenobacter busanensis TaxID=2607656 RepID=A0A7L4ZTE7_9BACT|nr:hydroxyisourate hydrolase [Hymenobacter busanensis]KAA9327577.1 hydroxyisourate hydrolase [Hymenobacter busanensis]QHJ06085.1 hydroxyisourate hydrolase [Hymenobacter busanensis]